MDAVVRNRPPTVDEYCELRRAAGWRVPDATAAAGALQNSRAAVCVEKDGKTIGMGRVVGDGWLVFYVQDVIVLPEHQRQGHGTMIMNALMEHIHRTACASAVIGLFAAKGLETFYARYDFIERPTEELGPGMVFFKK